MCDSDSIDISVHVRCAVFNSMYSHVTDLHSCSQQSSSMFLQQLLVLKEPVREPGMKPVLLMKVTPLSMNKPLEIPGGVASDCDEVKIPQSSLVMGQWVAGDSLSVVDYYVWVSITFPVSPFLLHSQRRAQLFDASVTHSHSHCAPAI